MSELSEAPSKSNTSSPKYENKVQSVSVNTSTPVDVIDGSGFSWPVQGPLTIHDKEKLAKALDWLKDISYVEINKSIELAEVGCCEQRFKYKIYNKEGKQLADVKEHGRSCLGFLCRRCCHKHRGYAIMIESLEFGESFVCQRWYKPFKGFCPPCLECTKDQMFINALNGEVLANCIEACTLFTPRYTITDVEDNFKFKVDGPRCKFSCPCNGCKNIPFKVVDKKGAKVGKIYKKWGRFMTGMVQDPDCFVAEFSQSMEPNFKAAIIGLTFLIDCMYYEDGPVEKKKKKTKNKKKEENMKKADNLSEAEDQLKADKEKTP